MPWLNPLTKKRVRRFMEMRRAWWSLLFFSTLFGLSLVAELICNDRPLLLYHGGHFYLPLLRFYPESTFVAGGGATRPDYQRLLASAEFRQSGGWALSAPVRNGPYRVVAPGELAPHLRVSCRLQPQPRVGGISLDAEGRLTRFVGSELFLPEGENWQGRPLDAFWELPEALTAALARRRLGEPDIRRELVCRGRHGLPAVRLVLAAGRGTTRMTLRGLDAEGDDRQAWWFRAGQHEPQRRRQDFRALPEPVRQEVLTATAAVFAGGGPIERGLILAGRTTMLRAEREVVRFPFRPVTGHWLGIDDAGRDIFARILYGLRSSLSFGLILVVCSLSIGTLVGMAQGYLGGWVDMAGQRSIEIWSSLPFLYIIILLGSIYGPSFTLLIFCYALFNWIGISYYMRAEMLRLRKMPFVEAARCLGLPGWKIAVRHILPNALVPLITFFPFSLVGAIGSLAALDYLGFGLPPPTPSLGQLLQQAQSQRWAWWLILYPSLTLFGIMLLGVFIGEGVRNAFDPRRQSRLQ